MRFRLNIKRKKETDATNQQQIHHAAPPHQPPPDNNHGHTLQEILAAIYNALRPHPDALPKVESVLAQLLGPQSPGTPNPTTTTTTTTTINT